MEEIIMNEGESDTQATSRFAAFKSYMLEHPPTRKQAMKAYQQAKAGNSAEAEKAHPKAAAAHDDAAEQADDEGDRDVAKDHRKAARLHRRAAAMHAVADINPDEEEKTVRNRSVRRER